jgi:hypothetical protein
VSGCAGGAIASNSPASNGQTFVSGSPGTTVYRGGNGPVAPAVSGPLLGGGGSDGKRFGPIKGILRESRDNGHKASSG